LKFRRQVPIDRYIVDFYCPEIRVIIEIDGGIHDQPKQAERDEERNKRLLELGYKLLRVPNEDVLKDPEWFTERIRSLHPSPGAARHPLPSGEGFHSTPDSSPSPAPSSSFSTSSPSPFHIKG
jgi:hypothetical protein